MEEEIYYFKMPQRHRIIMASCLAFGLAVGFSLLGISYSGGSAMVAGMMIGGWIAGYVTLGISKLSINKDRIKLGLRSWKFEKGKFSFIELSPGAAFFCYGRLSAKSILYTQSNGKLRKIHFPFNNKEEEEQVQALFDKYNRD